MMMRWDQTMSGPWFGGWGILWMFMMMVFWLLVLLGLVFLVRWLWRAGSRTGTAQPPEESAMEVLKKRYARGEIGKEEFEARKRDLI